MYDGKTKKKKEKNAPKLKRSKLIVPFWCFYFLCLLIVVAVFALIGLIGLGLTELLMWLFAGRAGLHYLPSKLLTTALVFIWNFAAKKLLLFRNR